MRVLRILVAGLIAIGAVVAVMFAALVVFFTGLAAYVLQLFGAGKPAAPSGPGRPPDRRTTLATDDAIDIESTKVPEESARR
jgi:hypothetical protein